MVNKNKDLLNLTLNYLKEHGAQDVHIAPGEHRHMRALFRYQGQNLRATIPSSSSNPFAEKAQKSFIKRILREADERAALLK